MSARRGFCAAGGIIGGSLIALWCVPFTPLRQWPVLSSLVAIDALLALFTLAIAVTAVVFSMGRWRRRWLLVGASAVAISALFGGRYVVQGISDGTPPEGNGISFVAWNAGDVDPGSVADLIAPVIEDVDADVVVLPETGWDSGQVVGQALEAHGFKSFAFAPESSTTAVLLQSQLAEAGGYKIDEAGPPWAGTVVRPDRPSPTFPVIVGVHVQQPALTSTDTWALHLEWLRSLCESEPHLAIIGDFNSTRNSLGGTALGECTDVASAHGAGAAATWPTALPPILGIAIDRFFVGSGYSPTASAFEVRRSILGSDHWAIVGEIPAHD